MSDPLKPSTIVLCKLGSIVIHAEELLSPDGHHFDREAMLTLCKDPDVRAWLSSMRSMALIPEKRKCSK